MAIIRKPVTEIGNSSGIPGYEHSINDVDTAIVQIGAFAKKYGVRLYPLDIEDLLMRYGISFEYEDMDDEVSGYLSNRGGSWHIGINQYHNPRRQRFILAHEFAHFLMHKEHIKNSEDGIHRDIILFRDNENNKQESEANDLASKLLIPEDKIKELARDGTTDVSALASYFNVSVPALRYRAFKLGMLKRY